MTIEFVSLLDDIQAELRSPLVRVDWNAKTIDLVDENQQIRTWKDPYWIPFDRIRTEGELLSWIQHLCEKSWFTRRHVREVIGAWQSVSGRRIPNA